MKFFFFLSVPLCAICNNNLHSAASLVRQVTIIFWVFLLCAPQHLRLKPIKYPESSSNKKIALNEENGFFSFQMKWRINNKKQHVEEPRCFEIRRAIVFFFACLVAKRAECFKQKRKRMVKEGRQKSQTRITGARSLANDLVPIPPMSPLVRGKEE